MLCVDGHTNMKIFVATFTTEFLATDMTEKDRLFSFDLQNIHITCSSNSDY